MRGNNIMKRVLSIALSAAMALTVFTALPCIGEGQVHAATVVKGKTTTDVNVRTDAGTEFDSRGLLEEGKTFRIRGAKKDSDGKYWYRITYKLRKGYVCGEYVRKTGTNFNVTALKTTKGTTTASYINVRLGPGVDYISVGKVGKNRSLTVDGKAKDSSGQTWYRISIGGIKAYISAAYIKVKEANAGSTANKIKTTDAVNVRAGAGADKELLGTIGKGRTLTARGVKEDSDGIYWYRIKYNSRKAYVSGKYVKRIGFTVKTVSNTKGTVTGNDVYVRLGPGKDWLVIAKADKGETYKVTGKVQDSSGSTWYRVIRKDHALYINKKYFKAEAENPDTSGANRLQTKSSVKVRSGAGTSYKVLGKLSKDKVVKATGVKEASDGTYWYRIKYNSGSGYISGKYVKKIGYIVNPVSNAKGTVTGNDVYIRLGPGKDWLVVGTAAKGKTYSVNGKSLDSNGGTWYRINYNGHAVYISKLYFKVKVSSGTESSGNAPKITKRNVTYPTTLAKGKMFTISGTLTSDRAMEKVEIGIKDSAGKWMPEYMVTRKPAGRTFDIEESADDDIKFGTLNTGAYYYECKVTGKEGWTKVFSYKFIVTKAPEITISNVTYPKSLGQYRSFTIKGKINSTKLMKTIVVGIADKDGDWVKGNSKTVTPNAKSYDLSEVDNYIKFGSLPTGSYYYRCYVTTASGTQTAFNYSFIVNKNTGIPSTLPYGRLSGDQRSDIVKIALAQDGYKTNSENHTAYNIWYYGSDTPAAWCAIFVSWCANQAGVSTGTIPKMAYVPSITAWYQSKGRFNAKSKMPNKGDLIIYSGSCHIGIVTDVDKSTGVIGTMEGNTGADQALHRARYLNWNSSRIKGYCQPAYN